jgi:hypothetical protein
MKKLITIITVIISLNLSAQKDTTAPKTITDTSSNICLSVSDINRYLQPLGDQIPYNKYQEILQVLSYFVATKQKELSQPKKK